MTRTRAIRQAITSLVDLDKFNDPCAVTLTMKQRLNSWELDPIGCSRNFRHYSWDLDPIECSRNFRHFSNRLNKSVFGNSFARYGKRLRIFPVLEISHSQRWHYHTVIDRPDRLTRDEFKDLVTDCWSRTLWGYREIDLKYDISRGWIDYITKPSQKAIYSDAIDWQNFHV